MSEAQLRQIAARLGGRAELLDVRLTAGHAQAQEFVPTSSALSVSLEVAPSAELADSDHAMVVTCRFDITIDSVDRDAAADSAQVDGPVTEEPVSTEPATVARLSCTYSALYDIGEEPDARSEDELDAFARTTGVFALYPYARAWAQDTTARMGLPPLTMQVYRMPLDPEDADG